MSWDFLGGSVVKNLPANAEDAGDAGSIPGLERSPGGGYGNPFSGKSHAQWSLAGYSRWGRKRWRQLSMHLWRPRLQKRNKNHNPFQKKISFLQLYYAGKLTYVQPQRFSLVRAWFISASHRISADAGEDWGQEEKGATEREMVGWHHRLDGHEFEQAPGDSERQGRLACCSPWGCKESDTT